MNFQEFTDLFAKFPVGLMPPENLVAVLTADGPALLVRAVGNAGGFGYVKGATDDNLRD